MQSGNQTVHRMGICPATYNLHWGDFCFNYCTQENLFLFVYALSLITDVFSAILLFLTAAKWVLHWRHQFKFYTGVGRDGRPILWLFFSNFFGAFIVIKKIDLSSLITDVFSVVLLFLTAAKWVLHWRHQFQILYWCRKRWKSHFMTFF